MKNFIISVGYWYNPGQTGKLVSISWYRAKIYLNSLKVW